jgi:hypothetical protein
MARPDHSIDPRILEHAKEEFLAHGLKGVLKTFAKRQATRQASV